MTSALGAARCGAEASARARANAASVRWRRAPVSTKPAATPRRAGGVATRARVDADAPNAPPRAANRRAARCHGGARFQRVARHRASATPSDSAGAIDEQAADVDGDDAAPGLVFDAPDLKRAVDADAARKKDAKLVNDETLERAMAIAEELDGDDDGDVEDDGAYELDGDADGDDEAYEDDDDALDVEATADDAAAAAAAAIDDDDDEVAAAAAAAEEEEDEGNEDDDEGIALLRELFEFGDVAVNEWTHLGEDEDVEVSGIADDSRVVLPGDVFVCVPGATFDGHDFALDAVAAGAVAVVCEGEIEGLTDEIPQVVVSSCAKALGKIAAAFYGSPSQQLTTVGVTGTNGKTTTTHLIQAILAANDVSCGVVGTVGYEIGDVKLTPHGGVWESDERDPTADRACTAPGWLAPYKGKYEVPNTTPDALQTQQILAGMIDAGAGACAMEVSSHALELGRVDECDFDVAVFTNLSRDHLDFHGSMEKYREAKAKLFHKLTDPARQRAVINIDDPYDPRDDMYDVYSSKEARVNAKKDRDTFDNAAYFIEAAGGGDRVPIITYATQPSKEGQADVFVSDVKLALFETTLTIQTPVGEFEAVCGVVGKINVTNIAAAVAVGVALEIPLDVIAAGVEEMTPVPGRMELIDEGQPFSVIVDYAHTPDALKRAITSLRAANVRNVITVFGCGGDRDASKRKEMGEIADTYSDIVFVTNDNPRTEDPYKILDDVVAGFRDRIYNLEAIKEEAMFPFLKDMYLIHPNARHETMQLQNMCRRYVIVDRWYAIRGAIAMAGEDDAVLICGKGHEDYIVVGGNKHWFDDRVEARDALRKVVAVQEAGVDTQNLPWGRPGSVGNGNVLDA